MLKGHVRLRLKTNACTEDISKSAALLGQCVDNWSSRRCQGSLLPSAKSGINSKRATYYLQHIAQNAKHAVETFVFVGVITVSLPCNASHHLSNDHKIDNQWRRQEGILANVEQADGLVATHENLRIVLVKSTFVIADGWHVLDHHAMIWMLAGLVQNVVDFNHVVNNVGFGDLLGSKLLLGAQVLAVIVAKMIVAGDGSEPNTSIDHKVCQRRFHLGLSRLEVVATNESPVLLSKLNSTRYKGILRRSINEWSVLEDTSDGKDC